MHTTDEPELTPSDQSMLTTFMQQYGYAASVQEASEIMTTAQIYATLKESQGGKLSFSVDYLDNLLFSSGYGSTFLDITKFWLLKKL